MSSNFTSSTETKPLKSLVPSTRSLKTYWLSCGRATESKGVRLEQLNKRQDKGRASPISGRVLHCKAGYGNQSQLTKTL